MSDKKKTRVDYELEPSWDGAGYRVKIHTYIPVESAQEALAMMMSMYKLENPDDVDITVSVKGNDAVKILFGMEK